MPTHGRVALIVPETGRRNRTHRSKSKINWRLILNVFRLNLVLWFSGILAQFNVYLTRVLS
jgi:hypothetical protein